MNAGFVFGLFGFLMLIGCSGPRDQELMDAARNAQNEGNYPEAMERYQQLIDTYKKSELRPEALYMNAAIYKNSAKDFKTAIRLYRQLAVEYPDHQHTPSAMFIIGFVFANEMNELDSARIAYEEYLDRFPNHEMASSAQFEIEHLGRRPEDILSKANLEESTTPKK